MCLPPSVVNSVSCCLFLLLVCIIANLYVFLCLLSPIACCLFLLLPASATCIYYCLCLLVGLLGPVSAVVLFYIACLLPVYFLILFRLFSIACVFTSEDYCPCILLPVFRIAWVCCCLCVLLPVSAVACVSYCLCLPWPECVMSWAWVVNRPVFQFETEHAAVIQFTTPSMDINIQSKRIEEGYCIWQAVFILFLVGVAGHLNSLLEGRVHSHTYTVMLPSKKVPPGFCQLSLTR
jgi:hypothetical protein